MATQKQFDFDSYNKVMKNANSGLKLYLAEQLLQDVQGIMIRFKSPLRNDITSIVDELGQLRADNKKYLASRETTTSGEIDNANVPSDTPKMVADYTNKHGDVPADSYAKVAETLGDAPV